MTSGSGGISAALIDFIDASPSPFHVVATAAERLRAAGFAELAEAEVWNGSETNPPGRFVRRGGSLVAWRIPSERTAAAGYRIIGAHTDSPNLRVKPRPDTGRSRWRQVGVEVYGGVLLNSWLDRDLGLSGIVVSSEGGELTESLLTVDEPILRIPQLAIHLDREVNERGLILNPQTHLAPVWGLGDAREGEFVEFLGQRTGTDPNQISAWTVMAHDLTPATIAGVDGEFLAAPRIDNQASCFAAVSALCEVSEFERLPVVCLFDHEEVGSVSAAGAAGSLLPHLLTRIARQLGDSPETHDLALARSVCVSADGAHATHPNYADRHEPDHQIELNRGPVIKQNSNQRYATDPVSAGHFAAACEAAGVPFQWFVSRTDLPCGSTIGPVTAAGLGIPTVDVGIGQLAMHSAREMCGSSDPASFVAALTAFLST